MNRTKFRKLWLISSSIMVASAFYSYNKHEETTINIDRKVRYVERLKIERRSGGQISSALDDLDSRTIDENNATRLDILRYLGLEESRLQITISNPFEKRIGKTKVVTRDIVAEGRLSYNEAMNQLDYFHNTKKISIRYIKMLPASNVYGDMVTFTLGGTIYGLKK